VQTFIPSRQEASAELRAAWPNPGDLVLLTYVPRARGHALTDIGIVGKTIVGTIKEIAEDDSWIVVRTQLPEKREYEVNIPLQTGADFKPLVSAMRQGDGIRATYVREGGINSSDETAQVKINHVRSLEWQSEPVGRAARWASLLIAIFVLFILAYIFTRGHPTYLYLGRDNRYSSSKFQTFLWFCMENIEFRGWLPCRMSMPPCCQYSAWARQPISARKRPANSSLIALLIRSENTMNCHSDLTRNPAQTNNGALCTSLDTGFRGYDVCTVCSPAQ
jgi:hypothetical protein